MPYASLLGLGWVWLCHAHARSAIILTKTVYNLVWTTFIGMSQVTIRTLRFIVREWDRNGPRKQTNLERLRVRAKSRSTLCPIDSPLSFSLFKSDSNTINTLHSTLEQLCLWSLFNYSSILHPACTMQPQWQSTLLQLIRVPFSTNLQVYCYDVYYLICTVARVTLMNV